MSRPSPRRSGGAIGAKAVAARRLLEVSLVDEHEWAVRSTGAVGESLALVQRTGCSIGLVNFDAHRVGSP